MCKTVNQRISGSARRYLEATGLEVIGEFEWNGKPFIAADDDGEIVIARVSFRYDRFPKPWKDREQFEEVAAFYLRGSDDTNMPVRGDSIDLLVLSDERAFLRRTTNCFDGFCEV